MKGILWIFCHKFSCVFYIAKLSKRNKFIKKNWSFLSLCALISYSDSFSTRIWQLNHSKIAFPRIIYGNETINFCCIYVYVYCNAPLLFLFSSIYVFLITLSFISEPHTRIFKHILNTTWSIIKIDYCGGNYHF